MKMHKLIPDSSHQKAVSPTSAYTVRESQLASPDRTTPLLTMEKRAEPGSRFVRKTAELKSVADNRMVISAEPGFQANAVWKTASVTISEKYLREQSRNVDLLGVVEALSTIQLQREFNDGTATEENLQAFPGISSAALAKEFAIRSFIKAQNDADIDDVLNSWSMSGTGYAHRKNVIALSTIGNILSLVQSATPEVTARIVLNVLRVVVSAGALSELCNVGEARLYYKLTERLVTKGLPLGTPSFKNAPQLFAAYKNLPGVKEIRNFTHRYSTALTSAQEASISPKFDGQRIETYQHLQSMREQYKRLDKRVQDYLNASRAAAIEWAPKRQRAIAIASTTISVAATVVGLATAPLVVPLLAGASVALIASVSMNLAYHYLDLQGPDNQEKLKEALVSGVLKSKDLFDEDNISRKEILEFFCAYQRSIAHKPGEPPKQQDVLNEAAEKLVEKLKPYLNQQAIRKSWGTPIEERFNLAGILLTGELVCVLGAAQRCKENSAAGTLLADAEKTFKEKRTELKQAASDLLNLEIFKHHIELLKKTEDLTERENFFQVATRAMAHIENRHFRQLMNGNITEQMESGDVAAKYTKGELAKYTMTYMVGGLIGDLASLGITCTSAALYVEHAIHSVDSHGIHAHTSSTPFYQLSSAIGLYSGANAPEVAAQRAAFGAQTARMLNIDQSGNVNGKRTTVEWKLANKEKYFLPEFISEKEIDAFLSFAKLPNSIEIIFEQAQAMMAGNLELSSVQPYFDSEKERQSWREFGYSAKTRLEVFGTLLGVAIGGLPLRAFASMTTLKRSRKARRHLEEIDILARKELQKYAELERTGLLSQNPDGVSVMTGDDSHQSLPKHVEIDSRVNARKESFKYKLHQLSRFFKKNLSKPAGNEGIQKLDFPVANNEQPLALQHGNFPVKIRLPGGIANNGTDCFLNCNIQLISAAYEEWFNPSKHLWVEAYRDVQKQMWQVLECVGNGRNVGNELIGSLRSALFQERLVPSLNGQEDAGEVLMNLLAIALPQHQYIHVMEERSVSGFVNSSKNRTGILTVHGEREISRAPVQTLMFDVDMSGYASLKDYLASEYSACPATTVLDASNRYAVAIDGEVHHASNLHVRRYFTALPDVMTFNLMRFHVNPEGQHQRKHEKFDMPLVFTLEIDKTGKKQSVSYRLCAFIVHSGELDSGHYTMDRMQDTHWVTLDDEKKQPAIWPGAEEEQRLHQGYLYSYRKIPDLHQDS